MAAQAKLPSIQGVRRTYYAGAWAGYGFHEDGIRSAVAVVEAMGGRLPWVPRPVSPKVTLLQQLYLRLFHSFAGATITQGKLRMILPTGYELHYGSDATSAAPVPVGEEWRGRPPLRATVRVMDMDFFRKVVLRHDVGLGEAYMAGDFEVDSQGLGGLLAVITANAVAAQEQRGRMGLLNRIGDRLLYWAHLRRPNTVEGAG